jgi:hypothetical protein
LTAASISDEKEIDTISLEKESMVEPLSVTDSASGIHVAVAPELNLGGDTLAKLEVSGDLAPENEDRNLDGTCNNMEDVVTVGSKEFHHQSISGVSVDDIGSADTTAGCVVAVQGSVALEAGIGESSNDESEDEELPVDEDGNKYRSSQSDDCDLELDEIGDEIGYEKESVIGSSAAVPASLAFGSAVSVKGSLSLGIGIGEAEDEEDNDDDNRKAKHKKKVKLSIAYLS